MINMNQKEQLFYDELKNIFIGEKIEGQSGFANLMRLKSAYFDQVFKDIDEKIKKDTNEFPEFREELYDKLYTFLKKYFTDSGSILYKRTTPDSKIYEKVYDNEKDVSLFWKTNMLFYVKTEKVWKPLTIEEYEIEGETYDFIFDVSELEGKRGNVKNGILFELDSVNGNKITFKVKRRKHGRKTKSDNIRKTLNKKDISIKISDLEHLFKTFEKQNEVDFFINKNAEEFLKEQFDLWIKHYVLEDETIFQEKRLKKLKILREVAYKIIDFVSQFEEEIRKIWTKPKFALDSNYVITLDKIMDRKKGDEIISEIQRNKGWKEQVEEWKNQDMIDKEPESLMKYSVTSKKVLKEKYKFLPIDTKYFKDIKIKILSLFDDLNEELDGELIHSENFQALNTLKEKVDEEVDLIYIDPPFNKESEANYDYRVKFKDSTWISLLENRITLAKKTLSKDGAHFVRCDYNGNAFVRMLMDQIFGRRNFKNEIQVGRISKQDSRADKLNTATDSLFFYVKDKGKFDFTPIHTELDEEKEERWHAMDSQGQGEGQTIFGYYFDPPEGRHWTYGQDKMKKMEENNEIRIRCRECGYYHTEGEWTGCPECGNEENVTIQYKLSATNKKQLDSNWTDIPGYTFNWDFQTENSEKLLRRVIKSSSDKGDTVMDYFLGSGTAVAVAHKMDRKWIGMEMGEQFNDVILPRMKKVVNYDPSGISERDDIQEKYNENKAGGMFKYYRLEQYEECLKNCVYNGSDPFRESDEESYEQYSFLKDKKMLRALELNFEKEEEEVDFTNLYPDVNMAETLSNLKGKKIKQISGDSVTFEGDEKVEFDNIDFETIKPLIWW